MPHFYFDLAVNGVTFSDADGVELADVSSASEEAVRCLLGIAKDEAKAQGVYELVIHVRNDRRELLFTARLTIETTSIHSG